MTHLQPNARRALAALAVLALAVGVGACSHHDDDDNRGQVPPPVAGTPNPPSVTDAFIAYVTQLVSTSDETSEPQPVDGIVTTAPEDSEPQPVS